MPPADDPAPYGRLLSNGRYTTLITGAGTGRSTWDGLALTAWTGDRTEDADGLFVYVQDLEDGALWSLGRQPVSVSPDAYAARVTPGLVSLVRRDRDVEASLEACVAPDADVELRRVRLVNHGRRPRRLAVTTYAEVVLHHPAAHAAHPAFSKLFVETEWAGAEQALLARRRPRSAGERVAWMVHVLAGDGSIEYDSARPTFLGRGHTVAAPRALMLAAPLAGGTGSVLDPVFALRRPVALAPDATAELVVLLGAADTRDAALALAGRWRKAGAVFAGAAARETALRVRLGLTNEQAETFQDLAGALLYGLPASDAALVKDAQEYWRALGVEVGGLPGLRAAPAPREARAPSRPVGGEECPPQEPDQGAVRGGTREGPAEGTPPRRAPFRAASPESEPEARPAPAQVETLLFENAYGGFSADAQEYVIRLDRERPPMPWINVVANERVGFLVSEAGAGYTWSRNSRENRLTPWSNDPIADPHGEALYLRDDDAGVFWSPLPGPVAPLGPFEVRHGFGYSRWRHASRGFTQDVCLFVPPDDPVKVVCLRLTNDGDQPRRLTVFSYARLVLGVLTAETAPSVVTALDPGSGALLASNPQNGDFADGLVFAAAVAPPGAGPVHHTGDRTAFLGRHGSPSAPAALCEADVLDGRVGVGLDPCLAFQVPLTLAAGATVECAFLLGEVMDADAARALVAHYRRPGAVGEALDAACAAWRATLSAVRVETPVPALDVLLNGWLGYQNLACRIRGRSAFYQSGGAFGFRDQLQDAAALVYARPDVTRAQIVLHAAHQFVEGDVLHWWHPPRDRGTRTRFSDDLVWLPYVTAFYVRTTGDESVLDERVGFVDARPLEPGEDEAYLLPARAGAPASVYEHCCRALDRALTRGAHGLPLMGTGDWNDGMNRVGREGRGESVWLGFFLYHVLADFIPLCTRRGDRARAGRYRAYRTRLRVALNDAGWDGAWYRRAYYDDGTPLGSAANDECRIDALAQAWAVISGAAPPDRAAQAMDAVERQLVDDDAGIVRLLAPPFDRTTHDPGYIKGYVPGIRENGGQYTHAALWVVRALAELGRRDRAAALLEMLGPVHHGSTSEAVAIYQVEPYVVAADVYSVAPHVGRGGWTWYTGSAGWMYRVALESVLGVTLEGGRVLRLRPCIPDAWPGFRVALRLPDGTRYEVEVTNPTGDASAVVEVLVDGRRQRRSTRVGLRRDGALHRVAVVLGTASVRGPRNR